MNALDIQWQTGLPLTFGERSGRKKTALVRASVRMALFRQRGNDLECLFVSHPVKGFEVPGGAVDPDEVPLTSALRELAEEAGIEIDPAETPVHLAGFVPITDQHDGRWLDIVFTAQFAEGNELNSPAAVPEFSMTWLKVTELEQYLSTNAQQIVQCALSHIQTDN